MSDILFKNVNVIDPETNFDGFRDVLVKDKFIKLIENPDKIIPSKSTKTISLKKHKFEIQNKSKIFSSCIYPNIVQP